MAANGISEHARTVIGINFGNAYASIAVITNDKAAECIANEDGERQIACAVAFNGEEVYIGNQAKVQLVKNAKNTIVGFRNLLGKKFADVANPNASTSASVIKDPASDLPAYQVDILIPVPPRPVSKATTLRSPMASMQPTPMPSPPPEPEKATRILTVPEVTTLFLRSLLQSAQDFLGKPVDGAVIAVPSDLGTDARQALTAAAQEAGINVIQLLDEPAAAAVLSASVPGGELDRTVLVVDLGASTLALSLLSMHAGLAHVLASSTTHGIGGDAIDDRLIAYFAKEFTKRSKIKLSVPATDPEDVRAEAKLRLAVEHTKRTLSASAGPAACSVESLKRGEDFAGAINRLRFDLELAPVYARVGAAVRALLEAAGRNPVQVDAVRFVGGSGALPGLAARLELLFPESTDLALGGADPAEVLARGCALQARLHTSAAAQLSTAATEARATARPLGLVFPAPLGEGEWAAVVPADTPLPCRRSVVFDVNLPADGGAGHLGLEIWECEDAVEMREPPKGEAPPPLLDDTGEPLPDEDDDEEEPEEPVAVRVARRTARLGALHFALAGVPRKKGALRRARVEVQFAVALNGALRVQAWEMVGGAKKGELVPGEKHTVSIPAPA